MKRLICFFMGHTWEWRPVWLKIRTIRCERCGKKEVVL